MQVLKYLLGKDVTGEVGVVADGTRAKQNNSSPAVYGSEQEMVLEK